MPAKPESLPHSHPSAAAVNLADVITHDIRTGIYPVGAWLKQADLELRYGRNRNEIRRALERLAQLRVVAHVKNRGFHLFPAEGTEVANILEIRVILETAVAKSVIDQAQPGDLSRLETLANRFARLARRGQMLELYEANVAFHQAVLGLCPNRELRELVDLMHQRIPSALTTQWRTRARVDQSSREHLAMVQALRERDLPRLEQLVRAHILQAPGESTSA